MTIHFHCLDPKINVAYYWGDHRIPVEGEVIVFEGSDSKVPEGQFVVWRPPAFVVERIGPDRVICDIRPLAPSRNWTDKKRFRLPRIFRS